MSKETVIDDAKTAAPEEAPEEDKKGKSISDAPPKDEEKNMRRVFRVTLFRNGIPFKENIVTLLQIKSIIEGTEIPDLCISLQPNTTNQYVLTEGAIQYDKQLEALRKWENGTVLKGVKPIKEINPKLEGVPWIPQNIRKIKELEDEIKKLKAKS